MDLKIDRRTKDIVAKKAEIVTPYQDSIKPDPKITEGKSREVGPVDLEALIHYIQQLPQPFDAQIEGRIQQLR